MSIDRSTAAVVLALGTLVLTGFCTSLVLALRSEDGRFPLVQVPLALLALVGMLRAAAVLRARRAVADAAG